MSKTRNWCARCSFGKAFGDFLFGTVQADGELEAERLLIESWASICPHQVEIKAVIPGMLIFNPE